MNNKLTISNKEEEKNDQNINKLKESYYKAKEGGGGIVDAGMVGGGEDEYDLSYIERRDKDKYENFYQELTVNNINLKL